MKPPLAWTIAAVVLILICVGCQRSENPAKVEAPAKKPSAQWKGKTHLVISAARANFPRLATWLYNGLYNEFPHREFTGEILFTGSGYAIELRNIESGEAQLAVITPSATSYMAYNGVGLFSQPNKKLRGMFKIGQRDFITFAVPASLGVKSFEEIIQKKIPLKIAAGFQDGDDTTGFLFAETLKAYGTSIADLQSWGGKVVNASTAGPGLQKILDGEADSIFHEGMALSSPLWKKVNEKTPMRVLSIRQDVIDQLAPLGFRKFERPFKKGSFPGVLDDVTTIDYSDWIVIGDASISDGLAYKIAKAAVDNIPAWVTQDPTLHTEESGELGNLIPNPKTMWKDLGAPLHPGAGKYYREKGFMQ